MNTLTVILPGNSMRTFHNAEAAVADSGVLTVVHDEDGKTVKTTFSPSGWSDFTQAVSDSTPNVAVV